MQHFMLAVSVTSLYGIKMMFATDIAAVIMLLPVAQVALLTCLHTKTQSTQSNPLRRVFYWFLQTYKAHKYSERGRKNASS